MRGLVEEGHVPHGRGLVLGVHFDPVPAAERDGGVVAVTDAAFDEDGRVSAHDLPVRATCGRVSGDEGSILILRQAAGSEVAYIDGLARGADEALDDVGLASAAAERFVGEDEVAAGVEVGSGGEEPLALADERGIAAAPAIGVAQAERLLARASERRLERVEGLSDGRDRTDGRNGGDKPVAFVVAAEELLLVGGSGELGKEEEVTIARANVDRVEADVGEGANEVELTGVVVQDVDRERARGATGRRSEADAGTERVEGANESVRVHVRIPARRARSDGADAD